MNNEREPLFGLGRSAAIFMLLLISAAGFILYLVHLRIGFHVDRILAKPFQLFTIYWSGVVLLVSFGVGYAVAQSQPVIGLSSTDRPLLHRPLLHRPLTVLLLGWLGARLFDVFFVSPVARAQGIQNPADYFANPIFLFDLNWGGLNVWGALFIVGLWLLWFAWRKGLPLGAVFHKSIVGLLAGLSVMQWGHFLTQELYGYPWAGWGAISIETAYRLPQFLDQTHFVPIFLFAAGWYLIGALWLAFDPRWQHSERRHIDAVMVGLLWFMAGRLCIELATPNSLVNWLPASIVLLFIAAIGLWNQRRVISLIPPSI